MQIHMIRAFLQPCADGSVSKSSENLNISQQGLSRQLLAMERELGIQLFVRSSQGLTLTADGELVRPHFEEICRQYDAANSALRIHHRQEIIRLGFTYSSTYATGLNFVLTYQTIHPGVAIQISSLTHNNCEQQLLRGELDAALITCPGQTEAFNRILVFESRGCAVVNRNHRLAGKKSIHLEELIGETVFMPNEQYRMRQLFDTQYQHLESRFKSIFSSGEHTEYIKLLSETEGVALTFEFLCGNLGPQLVCIPVAEDFPARIYFCTNKKIPASRQLRNFMQYVQRTLGVGHEA